MNPDLSGEKSQESQLPCVCMCVCVCVCVCVFHVSESCLFQFFYDCDRIDPDKKSIPVRTSVFFVCVLVFKLKFMSTDDIYVNDYAN